MLRVCIRARPGTKGTAVVTSRVTAQDCAVILAAPDSLYRRMEINPASLTTWQDPQSWSSSFRSSVLRVADFGVRLEQIIHGKKLQLAWGCGRCGHEWPVVERRAGHLDRRSMRARGPPRKGVALTGFFAAFRFRTSGLTINDRTKASPSGPAVSRLLPSSLRHPESKSSPLYSGLIGVMAAISSEDGTRIAYRRAAPASRSSCSTGRRRTICGGRACCPNWNSTSPSTR